MLDISVAPCYYIEALERAYAPVAQLDRVTDYESVGQGFESLLAYQNGYLRVSVLFIFQGLEDSDATVRWTVAPARLDGQDTSVFAHSRAKTQTSPFWRTRTWNRKIPGSFYFSGLEHSDATVRIIQMPIRVSGFLFSGAAGFRENLSLPKQSCHNCPI